MDGNRPSLAPLKTIAEMGRAERMGLIQELAGTRRKLQKECEDLRRQISSIVGKLDRNVERLRDIEMSIDYLDCY